MAVIFALKHPNYFKLYSNYIKWRLTMESGDLFKDTYLKKFSIREDDEDFKDRKSVTYVPSFASAAITEIVNAIYQRMSTISRLDGPKSYQAAISGKDGGVDLYGSSMNTYIGQEIIIELLSMSQVGVFIDKPPLKSNILSDAQGLLPYLYTYKTEDILNWEMCTYESEQIYTNLLLKDCVNSYDDETGLIKGTSERYRRMWLTKDGVMIQLYDHKGDLYNDPILLPGMKRIPFVLFSLNKSLLVDAANYQIALMNLSSSDLTYILKSNFPFYTEQGDDRIESEYLKQAEMLAESEGLAVPKSRDKNIKVGATHGRRYALNTDRPDFIHPSPEPLLASMKKQEQMKEELRQLINLSLASVKATHASAESKGMDDRSLEGGLAAIGLELQHGENQIAKIWAMYEATSPAQVKYPITYSLLTEGQRKEIISQLKDIRDEAPSITFRKEVCKLLAKYTLAPTVSDDVLIKINGEIDIAKFVSANADDIRNDVETGLVSATTASDARGYDGNKEVPIAQKEHADRLARISAAQGGTNLNPGSNGNPDKTSGTGLDGTINRDKTPIDQRSTTANNGRGSA